MTRVAALFIFVIGLAIGFYFLKQNKESDTFLKVQSMQSALFPVLGPILQEHNAQPVKVVFTQQAFGLVVRLNNPISDHSERENFRAKLTVAAREWAKSRPELSGLQVFVQYQDEVAEPEQK